MAIGYSAPLVVEYRSRRFKKSLAASKAKIESRVIADRRFHKVPHEVWVNWCGPSDRAGRDGWQPKIYLCVGASRYWSILHTLISRRESLSVRWKFYFGSEGYDRPDKIVFYPESPQELRRLIRILRPLLPGSGFHEIRHAAGTAELGLERNGTRGLYVGADPRFLKESWRIYRCICVAWASLNRAYLDELPRGIAGWYKRMNISLEHEGPVSLAPDSRDTAFVRRYWRMIGVRK